MFNKPMLVAVLLPLAVAIGCTGNGPNERPDPHPDGGRIMPDASTSPTADASSLAPVIVPRNPLGASCSAGADCSSGFCIDGVCCDSACAQTCYACNLPAAAGHCAAVVSGVDPNASPACTAPSACILPASSSAPLCKLVDGTACHADNDCISGHCLTYYVDADGDGYGTSQEAHFCEELNARPPAGYAAYPGDCCDLDSGANPGFDSTQFLQMPDACGSYDWNCNGVVAQETTCSTGTVACGQPCVFNLFGPITLFTEACN